MKEIENVNHLMNQKVVDKITGFKGTITAVVYYVASTTEVLVEASASDKNESKWVDIDRVNLLTV